MFMKSRITLLLIAASLTYMNAAKAWVLIPPTTKKPALVAGAPATPTFPRVGDYTATITTPISGSVYHTLPRIAKIQWKNDGWPSHLVEVTCDYCYTMSPWTSVVTLGSSNSSEYTITVPGDNMYRVRIQGFGPAGQGAWSSYHYFSFKT